MAVVSMQKIKLVALKKDEKKLISILQKQGVVEMTKLSQDHTKDTTHPDSLHKLELDIANLEFSIKLLKPFEQARGLLEGPLMFTEDEIEKRAKECTFPETIKKCHEIEEELVRNRNALSTLEALEAELLPWKNLRYKLDSFGMTEETKIILCVISLPEFEGFKTEFEDLSKLSHTDEVDTTETHKYVALIFAKDLDSKVRELTLKYKISVQELPKEKETVMEKLQKITKESKKASKQITHLEKELGQLAKESENLKITHDYLVWQKDSMSAKDNISNTEYSFAMIGWIPLMQLEKLEKSIKKETKEYEIFKIEKDDDEEIPVAIRNGNMFRPFESVTRIYGLPLANEIDPTPFLATFFIIFFGLCLTDAGYGLILFALTFSALRWMKIPKQSQGLIKLIMWGGIVTFIAGIFFGGWFGMTPDQAPGFLTYDKITESAGVDGAVVKAFKWQLINPSEGSGPLTFLILAAVLGIIQVIFGIILDGYWKIKHKQYTDALLDSGLWLYFLTSIMLFGVSKAGLYFAEQAEVFTNMTLIGVGLMVLTQGRAQKNIFMKFASGVLSLYNLVGYTADVLSYSRLMALGLGTGIIGFAMNTMAGLAGGIPYVGIVFAVIVIILGHTLNIAISTLGAFIHSSRLQFVEFFGKFMQGGGREFKPFRKNCKYIYIINPK